MTQEDVARKKLINESCDTSRRQLYESSVAVQSVDVDDVWLGDNHRQKPDVGHGDVTLDESAYDTEVLILPGESESHVSVARLAQYLNRDSYRAWLKRTIDIVVGALLLVLFSPVIMLSWLAVRLTSRGPGFFTQERIGLHGQPILMWKLRTMYLDHERRIGREKVAAIEQGETKGLLHKIDNDPRVTHVGGFLRTTSLDELPQLWNVVCGTMSLVGPRPLVPFMLAPFPEIAEYRNQVRPGITGLWQVSAREDNTSVLGMAPHDQEYADDYSLLMDLQILLKTPFVVLSTRGAQ